MKRTKLLSLFLAGSLLFQTAGIDAMATAPSEPAPVSETVEDAGSGLSEQLSEEESESKESTEEDGNSEQLSEGEEEGKDPAGEDENPGQSSDEESEEKDLTGEESDSEQPSDEEIEGDSSNEEDGEIRDSVSENTISENTLPEDETSIFSIFPGLGDNYKFSSQQLADKRVLAAHVGDVVQIDSPETATITDFKDVSDNYELGEVVYLAETKEEAEQVAKAFGGTLESYSYEVAVISLPEKATVALAIAAAAEPDIKLPAVWPNYYQYLHTDTNATVNPLKPSDEDFDKQWQHDYIGTRYAWAAGFKGENINVAVIDTGIQKGHDDLNNNVTNVYNFVGGKSDSGYNKDNSEHGTHVAGIIAAEANSIGGVGIAPDAQVTGYCVFPAGDNEKATSDDVIRAINAAVGMEAEGKKPEKPKNDIINMSLGSPQYSAIYETTVKNAYEAGVAIFASSGNDDTDGNNFPAAYASTISVGAVDQNSTRASFSNYGKTVTLSFPGVAIYSTVPTNSYKYMDGTSMACPAAAGTAAVILSARQDIRDKKGKDRVNALLSAMKSSTTKCAGSGMGAGTTYLPGVLKIATDMTAPETPIIEVIEEVNGDPIDRGTNKKDYIAESIDVTISTKTAVGVDIYYSTDGKAPAYKNGQITNVDNPKTPYKLGDKITLTGAKSKTIKAIAVNPFSGKVSKVATKTVTLTPIPNKVIVAPADNVTKIAAGKSLKFTATVNLPYAISNKVQWTVVDADNNDAKAKGVTVANGTVKTSATAKLTTPAEEYTVIATAVGKDGKTFNGVKDTCKFAVIETAAIKKIAFLDETTNKAPVAKSIKTTDSRTTDTDNQVIDLTKYLTVTKTTDAASKKDTIYTGADAAKEVVWSSNNTKVATVSNGVITAVAPGKATIKAISNDGGNKSASYTVTVVKPVTRIDIDGPKKVAAGKGIALTATVTPSDASNKKVEWTVVDEQGNASDKVSVNKSNGKISTKKNASGKYKVTATAADKLGAVSDAYTIEIVSEEITKITLNNTKLTMFPPKTSATENITATLIATVEGKTAGSSNKPTNLSDPLITWTSSAPSIADVSSLGVITAKAPGKATITCAATDGSNKKATCAVTVTTPMSKLVIGPADGNADSIYGITAGCVAVGKKLKMAAKYYSNYGTPTNKKISWNIVSYGNQTLKDKVKIDKNGTVSVDKNLALPSANAYIEVQATAQDGSGVTSNSYRVNIKKNYLAIAMIYDKYVEDFIVVATTNGKDLECVPDYCTVTVSGSKNCGVNKSRFRIENDTTNTIYASYSPVPTKRLTYLDFEGKKTSEVLKKKGDKITLTAKLKDGSNLSAKCNIYAVIYEDEKGDEYIRFIW